MQKQISSIAINNNLLIISIALCVELLRTAWSHNSDIAFNNDNETILSQPMIKNGRYDIAEPPWQ